MEIIRIPRIVQDTCRKYLMKGRTIGFVPTMGALHSGHMSLVRRCRDENDIAVASIFVNPIQFGPSEDLDKYPKSIDEDASKLKSLDVDILFLPDNSLMYPKDFVTQISLKGISGKLCGEFRPGHFSGVATVVAKLFNITAPTRAYFGQKDFQQTVVIRRMTKDLNFNTEIVICPTIRELDGLAMSSRNSYLTSEERKAAAVLYRSLELASEAISSGERSGDKIRAVMHSELSREPLVGKIEYASVYDHETLGELTEIQGDALLAIAARIGSTRLIDNLLVTVN